MKAIFMLLAICVFITISSPHAFASVCENTETGEVACDISADACAALGSLWEYHAEDSCAVPPPASQTTINFDINGDGVANFYDWSYAYNTKWGWCDPVQEALGKCHTLPITPGTAGDVRQPYDGIISDTEMAAILKGVCALALDNTCLY